MSLRNLVARGLGTLLTVGALVAALGGVLSHGATLDTRLDVLSHFAPVYLAVALICMAIAILARLPGRGIILVVSVVGVVAAGARIAPEFTRPDGSAEAFDSDAQIKVIQINALRTNADIGRVVDWLIAQNPDVVTITEARHDLRDLLIRRTGWSPAGARGSLMIFTHKRYVKMDRPKLGAGPGVSFVNATYETQSGPAEIVTIHLDWPSSRLAAGQVRDLEDVVRPLPRERMILTGDFNAAPWSAELRRLDASLGLIRRDRAVATWPAQLSGWVWRVPFVPIDHVYAGRGWATVKVERGPWLGSDHYPLVVTLAPVATP